MSGSEESPLTATQALVYLREIANQRDYGDIGAAMFWDQAGQPRPLDGIPVQVLYASAQAIITAASQVRKLLWPTIDSKWTARQQQFTKSRGEYLVSLVGGDRRLNTSAVRNSIEHFDQRLDMHFLKDPQSIVIDGNVHDDTPMFAPHMTAPPVLRDFNTTTFDISVLNKSVNLADLVSAMRSTAINAAMVEEVLMSQIRPGNAKDAPSRPEG